MHLFNDDDEGYLQWLMENPGGYVLNLREVADPNYVVLHRASCTTISSGREAGACTSRNYRKAVASNAAALSKVAREQGRVDGLFSKVCLRCKPLR